MRLSVVFELLLVFLFLAFAAARVIDQKKTVKNVGKSTTSSFRQGPPNRYCACTSKMCNCCRDFSLPVVPLKGPGCASVMYTEKDTMLVTLSFGDRILTNTTISGKNPKPICMSLPGGISQFCGRVYGISRTGDQFRACLGLELRALDDIEAALRVSCFKFGPKGVNLESAPPVPVDTKDPDDDDDDDDDDDYGLGVDDDLIGFDDDDDDDDDEDGVSSDDNEVDSDSVDYAGFSVLGEDILGSLFSDESSVDKKKKIKTAKPQVTVPKVSTTTRPLILLNKRQTTTRPIIRRPLVKTTKKPTGLKIQAKPSAASVPNVPNKTTALPMSSPTNKDKTGAVEKPATQPPLSATTSATQVESLEKKTERTSTHESNVMTMATEPPVTFTIPTEKNDIKNYVKIPQTDLNKIEALAAIAQQNFASGVITSGSSLPENTEEPLKEMMTVNNEKFRPTPEPESSKQKFSSSTEKINFNEFLSNTVVIPHTKLEPQNSKPSQSEGGEAVANAGFQNSAININKITPSTKAPVIEENHQDKEEVYDEIESDEDEENGDNEEGDEQEEEEEESGNKYETSTVGKVDQTLVLNNNADANDLKKPQQVEVEEDDDDVDDDDDDDDEGDDDFFSGIIDDEVDDNDESDSSEDIEGGSGDNDHKLIHSTPAPKFPGQNKINKNEKDKDKNDDGDEDYEDDDDDDGDGEEDDDDENNDDGDEVAEILGETPINQKKKNPMKIVAVKRPQASQKVKDNAEEDEDEDDGDADEGILDLLEPDYTDTDNESENSGNKMHIYKNKKKGNNSEKGTTIKVKPETSSTKKTTTQAKIQKPVTHNTSQNKDTRNPTAQPQTILTRLPTTTQQPIQSSTTENSNKFKQITEIVKNTKPATPENNQPLLIRAPTTQQTPQRMTSRKPVATTENFFHSTTPSDNIMVSDSGEFFIYRPENTFTEKVFTFTHPGNKFSQKLPQGVSVYQIPSNQKFVIYNEPEEKVSENPHTLIYNQFNQTNTKEKNENQVAEMGEGNDTDEDGYREEEAEEEENESEKNMLIASLMKKNPAFGNRNGEEHDLGETEDLDIEESDDEEKTDFEDRQNKQTNKSKMSKSPSSTAKPAKIAAVSPKLLKLTEFLTQPKRFYKPPDDRPISASRTHRRMNLDRLTAGRA